MRKHGKARECLIIDFILVCQALKVIISFTQNGYGVHTLTPYVFEKICTNKSNNIHKEEH